MVTKAAKQDSLWAMPETRTNLERAEAAMAANHDSEPCFSGVPLPDFIEMSIPVLVTSDAHMQG